MLPVGRSPGLYGSEDCGNSVLQFMAKMSTQAKTFLYFRYKPQPFASDKPPILRDKVAIRTAKRQILRFVKTDFLDYCDS